MFEEVPSKYRLAQTFILSAIFAVLSAGMLIFSIKTGGSFLFSAAAAGMLVYTTTIAYFSGQWLRTLAPAIVVDEDGVEIRNLYGGYGAVKWSAVERISIEKAQRRSLNGLTSQLEYSLRFYLRSDRATDERKRPVVMTIDERATSNFRTVFERLKSVPQARALMTEETLAESDVPEREYTKMNLAVDLLLLSIPLVTFAILLFRSRR